MPDLTNSVDNLTEALTACFFDPRMVNEATKAILSLDQSLQHFVFRRVISLAKTQPEIAYQFALNVNRAINNANREICEPWLQQSLDRFFTDGIHAAVEIMKNPERFILEYQQGKKSIRINDVRGILQNIINGLGGRALDIESSDETYTDCDKLYLPEIVDYFDNKNQNFAAYRAMLAHLWAQNHYGTWRTDLKPEVATKPGLLARFHYLETLRLNAAIERDFPGLWRQMLIINQQYNLSSGLPLAWREIRQQLAKVEASASDSMRLLHTTTNLDLPKIFFYQGILKPHSVEIKRRQRLLRDKQQFQTGLARMSVEQQMLESFEVKKHSGLPEKLQFKLKQLESTKSTKSGFGIELNGVLVPPDTEVDELMYSIIQDLGEIPSDYLKASNHTNYDAAFKSTNPRPVDSSSGEHNSNEKNTHYYPEWDSNLEAHRKNWCVLREKNLDADHSSNFVNETLHKYRGHIKSLRRSFEALHDEYKILKRQPDGENPDIDALVEAIADVRSGMEMTTRIYRKASRVERNIAVIFMVDMSSSTRGWINLAQREALVLLTEALQSLDDRYAIYGFSGMTRKRCELYTIKTIDENYNEEIKARISAIQPQEYTRMGVTIRHLSKLLGSINARTKLLIALSDGKPDDFDGYRGKYGIEDTRMALFEARQKGIHPFCITIDERARDYLPHMYGESNYVVIDNVAKLPYRISEIYRGLTS